MPMKEDDPDRGNPQNPTRVPPDLDAAGYEYELPEHLIAQEPPARRGESRLLLVPRNPGDRDSHESLDFSEFPAQLRAGDLLVLNDTRVIPARLFGQRVTTGGRAETLILGESSGNPEGSSSSTLEVLIRTRGHPLKGETFAFADGALIFTLLEDLGRGRYQVEPRPERGAFLEALEHHGHVPLPPYIHRKADGDPRDATDRHRYQTVFAHNPGAVAAPTAGLHFTTPLFEEIAARGVATTTVTLHVGAGTFRPVTCSDVRDHEMHHESYEVPESAVDAIADCRKRGGRVIPVGTTAVRVLESACDDNGHLRPGSGRTNLFILPSHRFRLVDALLTNFHAPRSTLLMLVSALAGRKNILAAYEYAVQRGMRFLSYGDAMFIC